MSLQWSDVKVDDKHKFFQYQYVKQDGILLAAVSWLTPGHLTDSQSFHFIQPVLYICSPLYWWNWNINKYCLMSIVSCFLYKEQYMCFFFHLVLCTRSILYYFPENCISCKKRANFCIFLFSSTKPAIWNFSTLLYVVLLQDTVDVCYRLQNFWQHFLYDAYCFKTIASGDPCSGDYFSHEHKLQDYLCPMIAGVDTIHR